MTLRRGNWRCALTAVGVLCVPAVGACHESLFEGELMWEGEHVRLWRENDTDIEIDDWCPGTLSHLDRFTLFASAQLEIGLSEPIEYNLLEGHASEYFPGCAGGIGCARDSDVYSPLLPHDHEIIHALRAHKGSSPQFFEEGAASYWGDLIASFDRLYSVRIQDLPGLSDTLAASWSRQMTLSEYEVAAQFTAFLVHTYGADLSVSFLSGTEHNTSRSSAEAVFERIYGTSLDAAMERYEAEWPECSYEAARSSSYDCAGTALPICDGTLPLRRVVEVDLSCADPAVIGPRGGWMWQDVVFDVIEPGPHRIVAEVPTSEDEHASHVVIKRCSTDCGEATPLVVPIQSEGNGRYELEGIESGRHVIRIYRSESLPGPVSIIWSCHG